MTRQKYPAWICAECGERYGRRRSGNPIAAWYRYTCDVCGLRDVPVTEPHNYGHLGDDWRQHGK